MSSYSYKQEREVSILLGQTIVEIVPVMPEAEDDELLFTLADGRRFAFAHNQACCESVGIEDVIGDLTDLIGSPLTMAEEVTHEGENPEGVPAKDYQYSWTWTFYKFATVKGYVTLRWYGESNGYYSEDVSLYELKPLEED